MGWREKGLGGGGEWGTLDMGRGKGITWQEQAGRGFLQAPKLGGDGRWVVARRDIVSGAAGCEGFKGCVFWAATSVCHPAQADAIFK